MVKYSAMVCFQDFARDIQCSAWSLGVRMRTNPWQAGKHLDVFDGSASASSSFSAIKLKRKGRTSDGHSCDCTDKPKKKEAEASPLNLFNKEEKSTDQIAKELERERQQAERENADQEMAGAFGDFEQVRGDYDKAMQDVEAAWKSFKGEQTQYETSFWLLKAIHDSECKKLMEDHHLVDADCHKNWVAAREEYFARVLVPQCVKGERAAFEFAAPPVAISWGLPQRQRELRGAREMRCFL